MSKYISGNIQPFVMKQTLNVYKDGECLESVECCITEYSKVAKALCKKYDIHEVDILGNENYLSKIKDDIVNNKFDDFKIDVQIY